MKKLIIALSLFFLSISSSFAVTNDQTISSIMKIKTYEYNPFTDTYTPLQYGSAIYLGDGKLVTNAHVVVDDKENPTGLYEVCFSSDAKREPTCTMNATLKTYDVTSDLALLQIQPPKGLVGLKLVNTGDPTIGSSIAIYGYPAIGGTTITRTEGVLAGYENDAYKIDATIDHGNSGGGAFDKAGNLVGIPQAIKRDNAVIGYVIPISVVQDFLSGKTSSVEKYTKKADNNFSSFLKTVQGILKNITSLVDNGIKLGDPKKYGFTLTSYARAKDGSSFSYGFSEKSKRVSLYFSCTKDSGYMEYWKIRQEDLQNEKKRYEQERVISDNDEKSFYTVKSELKKQQDDNQGNIMSIYFKKYDSCFASVRYTNPTKDKATIDKATSFARNIVVPGNYILPTKYDSPFFVAARVPADSFISDSVDDYGDRSAMVAIKIAPKTWASGNIEYMKIDALKDFFITPLLTGDSGNDSRVSEYNGSFSIESLRQRFSDYINSSSIIVAYSANGKPFILTSKYDYIANTGIVNFFYPYKLKTGEYGALYGSIDDTFSGDYQFKTVQSFFESINLPGTPAFDK